MKKKLQMHCMRFYANEARIIMATSVIFYLVPAAIIVAGVYVFIRFIPGYAAPLILLWVIIVSLVYVRYNKWY